MLRRRARSSGPGKAPQRDCSASGLMGEQESAFQAKASECEVHVMFYKPRGAWYCWSPGAMRFVLEVARVKVGQVGREIKKWNVPQICLTNSLQQKLRTLREKPSLTGER